MPQIRFSRRAQADLQNINGYTIATWGQEQATAYIDSLELMDKKLGRKRPSFLEQTQLPVILLTLIHNL